MADATGIRAGGLYWEVDVKQANNVRQRVAAIGRELEKALSTSRTTTNPALQRLAKDANTTSKALVKLTTDYVRFTNRVKDGGVELDKLARGLQKAGGEAGKTKEQYQGLAQLTRSVETAQGKLAAAATTSATATEKQRLASIAQAEAARKQAQALAFLAQEGSDVSLRVGRIADTFSRLKASFDLGQVEAREYASRLADLATGIQRTGNAAGLGTRELKALAGTFKQVAREQQSLGTGTQTVNQRVQLLVRQANILRTAWQTTGEATQETKDKLKALVAEMDKLQRELREGENGLKRYSPQIDRLGKGMRNATASIAGMEGRMSRLGLASQVNLALMNQLTASMYRLGPVGVVAGSSLGIAAGEMGALSVGALAAAGGVTALALGAATLFRRGVPQVKEFQTALRVLVATGEDFDAVKLNEAIRDAADAAGAAGKQFSRAEIATALAEIVKAGVEANDAIKLLAPGMQLAAVTGQTLNVSTTNLLANLRQFGLTTADAGKAADALAAADLAAAHGAAELSEGLATVGPVANAAGISFEDTLAILVDLDNKGLDPADKGATALRGTLSALLDPTDKARAVLARLGVSLKNAYGSSRPLLEVLKDVRDGLAGSGDAAAEAAKIFDTRAITAILGMSEASDTLAASLLNSAGAAKNYADVLLDKNLEASQNALKKSMDNLSMTFTSAFADDIAHVANNLSDLIGQVDRIVANPNKWATARQLINFVNPFNPRVDTQALMDEFFPPKGKVAGPTFTQPQTALPSTADIQKLLNGPAGVVDSLGTAIAKARDLKAALDNALTPKAWLAASDAVNAFRTASDENARAWDAVAATSKSTTASAQKDARTVQDIFDDLAKAGKQSERAADALGNTTAAKAQSLTERLKVTQSALAELLARPDVNTQENKDKVSYLLARAAELEAELKIVQAGIDAVTTAQAKLVAAGEEARDRTVASMRGATRQGLIETAERERIEALTATPREIEAAKEAAARIGASMAEATERGRQEAEERLRRTRKARGLAAGVGLFPLMGDKNEVFSDSQIASIESAVRIINSLNEATELGVAATARRAEAEHRLRLEIIERERISAKLVRIEEAQNALDAVRLARQKEAELARVRGSASTGAASLGAILTPENQAAVEAGIRIINSMTEATDRGAVAVAKRAEAEAKLQQALERRNDIVGQMTDATKRDLQATADSNSSVEDLTRRVGNLIKLGYDPASEAVTKLTRRVNELNLQLALQELHDKGAANLSEFAKNVLKANGVFVEMSETTSTLLQRLEALGGVSGGIVKFVDGLKKATASGASTADIIGGVTSAVDGLNEAIQGAASTADLIKGIGSGIAEIVGTAAGVPGLGALFSAVFDLGTTIVNAISDSFTGDSPAARAIRDGLTPAITGAFTTGIINGIRGADGWQDDLKDSLKVVFLQALIQAFVNGAIIQTILQPVIDQYSKMIAQGNIEAATAYLKTSLPGALDTATRAAEGFVATIPAGFLQPVPTAGGQSQDPNQPSTFRLPDALPAGSSAAVSNFGAYVGGFGKSVGSFGDWVRSLQQQGITVNVSGARAGAAGGTPQAARTA